VAQLAVPELADWCAVHIIDEAGSYHQVAVAHVDPAKVELARELQRHYPPDINARTGPANVIRTGQSELYPDISQSLLEATARDAQHLQLIRQLQIRSAMVTPLIARSRTLGAMTFISAESGRCYDQHDLTLAEELARRAALAVDNARLYQAEQQARQAAERAAERIGGLQAVTAALSEALTPIQVASVIVEKGLPAIGADSSVIVVLNDQSDYLEILHSTGYSAGKIETWQAFSVTNPNPLAETVRTKKPIFIESIEALVATYPEFAQQRDPTYNSLVALPLLVEGRAVGGIGLGFKATRTFSERSREFMLALAYQCAQALERARLYEAERQARTEAEAAQQHLALLAETRERNRLAQELHDNVAQALGYLNLKIGMTNMLLEQSELQEVKANLQELKNVIGEAYTDVREEIFNLRAKVSVGLGFLEMLDRYIDKYRRFYKLDIQLVKDTEEAFFEFPPEVGPQIIRTIQEALINIRKHARVDKAMIRLWQEGDQVCITVEDKGQGFDPAKLTKPESSSFGLQIMRERVKSVGGNFEIESKPGQGTRITLRYSKN
jgi:signal transduction histidine kinase